ncbi:ABC transporter substrate-binding protein [Planctomonas sp. JC2975]|nr:ABC transporter substrate-binding protein [Planctomonas sp. JC2975]NNC12900.1 ABC transporter substrate-binding protein [Planctomonas sp. JC2975]
MLGGALALAAGGLAGCTAADASGSLISVGFAQTGAESTWRAANTVSLRNALSRRNGFDLMFIDSQGRQENEIAAVRSFVTRGVDVIVLAPMVESGWHDVLDEARRAGIPVVLEDRGIDPSDSSLYLSRVGDDFRREGGLAAKWIIETAEPGTRIVELLGTTGSSAALDRSAGFDRVIAGHGIRILDAQDGGFTRAGGKEVMAAFLEKHGDDIQLLFAQNDDMGLGAIEAITAAGLEPGRDIRIVTIDGTRDALTELVAGRLNQVVQCNPMLGPRVASVVRAVHAGATVQRQYIAADRVFDAKAAKGVLATWPY